MIVTIVETILTILVVIYATIYYIWISPLMRIHNLQTHKWMRDLTTTLILGAKDKQRLNQIRPDSTNQISYWYVYWFVHTKQYTGWCLMNIQNKFSDSMIVTAFMYDFQNNKNQVVQRKIKFSELKTYQIDDNRLVIEGGQLYRQVIDFNNNTTTLDLNLDDIKYNLEFYTDDYTTNQATFIPRYNSVRKIIQVDGNETNSPGEWMSDNGMTGKLLKGTINNSPIDGGNFWFDNYIGVNNNFLCPYIWFVVLNDDWLIYLLWFGEYEERNKPDQVRPIIIRNRKENKVIYSGIIGKCPSAFQAAYNIQEPIEMFYNSKSNLGDEKYDNYEVVFVGKDISIKITSHKDQSHRCFLFDYYKTDEDVDMSKLSEWDRQYYKTLSNIKYVEYVNMVQVQLEYKGEFENFSARQVIDAKFRADPNIPYTISHKDI